MSFFFPIQKKAFHDSVKYSNRVTHTVYSCHQAKETARALKLAADYFISYIPTAFQSKYKYNIFNTSFSIYFWKTIIE